MKKKTNSKKFIILTIIAALLIGFAALVYNNYKTKTSFKYDTQTVQDLKPEQHAQDPVNAAVNAEAAANFEARKNSNLLKILPSDIVIGDKNAPVLMIEYASLSCPHCSAFTREVFDKFKTEYLDTAKVKFVYRDFPLNKQALTAAMFALCQAKDHKENMIEKYHETLKVLFKTQDNWAFDPQFEDKLEAIAKLDGMDSVRFRSCISDKFSQEKILKHRMEASKSLLIKSTPSFFVNGEVTEGYVDYLTLKKLIDKKLAEVKK